MTKPDRKNLAIAAPLAGLAVLMVGMAYAAVPLYDLFCRVTGYGGTIQRSQSGADRVVDRLVTIRFDANTNGLPWEFEPVAREIDLKLGETALIAYRARNRSRSATAGTATFNVSPHGAGAYFNKIECFCFSRQELAPGEEVEMPVQFFIDPDIVDDPELVAVRTITLSYTFFPDSADEKPQAGAPPPQISGEKL